jgi:hypothetical protein
MICEEQKVKFVKNYGAPIIGAKSLSLANYSRKYFMQVVSFRPFNKVV